MRPPLPATTEPLLSFAPAHVRRETLLQQAGIDSRSKDVLAVEVRVMASHFKGTPIISSVQYRANDEARRACAVAFIKNTTGLAMTCPKVPRYLVLRGAEFEAAIAQLTPEQRVWHDQLVEHSRSDFDSVRDNSPSDSVRADALSGSGSTWHGHGVGSVERRHRSPVAFADTPRYIVGRAPVTPWHQYIAR